MAPSAPHAHSANQSIKNAAQLPRPIPRQPTARAAERRETFIHRVRGLAHHKLAILNDHSLRAHKRQRRVITLAGDQRVAPRSFHAVCFYFVQRQAHAGFIIHWHNRRKHFQRAVIAHNHFASQALDQRLRNHRGNWRDQMHPVRRKPRRKHGHRNQAPLQSAHTRVASHHVRVGHHIAPANFNNAAGALRAINGGHQIIKHVANADGLRARVHPLGANHHGQTLAEIADHFK